MMDNSCLWRNPLTIAQKVQLNQLSHILYHPGVIRMKSRVLTLLSAHGPKPNLRQGNSVDFLNTVTLENHSRQEHC